MPERSGSTRVRQSRLPPARPQGSGIGVRLHRQRHADVALRLRHHVALRVCDGHGRPVGRAGEEDPTSPAPWNELAHHLSHNGRIIEAFVCFEKSLSLTPREAVYFFDFATTLLLYRSDGARHYQLTEQAVFEKVLTLYRRGMKLEPASFARAATYAETFYLITPARREEGLAAWHHAYSLATADEEREDSRVHLARYALNSHHPNLARCYLDQVSDSRLELVKEALLRRVSEAGKTDKVDQVPVSAPAAK